MPLKKSALQFSALPFCLQEGELSVLLITSRETGRWVIPKGWPEKDLTPPEVAAHEAYEEAGLQGRVAGQPIATFEYQKRLENGKRRLCTVLVFPFEVSAELETWPEQHQRRRQWMAPAEAAARVAELGLKQLFTRLADQEEARRDLLAACTAISDSDD